MNIYIYVTLSSILNLVHQNSCPKLSNFPYNFTQFCKFPGGGAFEKHAEPGKKNQNRRKSRLTVGTCENHF